MLRKLIMILGVIALAAALGVSAASASPAAPALTRTGPSVLWAVVHVDGTVARRSSSTDVISSTHTGLADGYTDVYFGRDVSGCAYTVTGGTPDERTEPLDDAVVFTAAPLIADKTAVEVLQYDVILARDSNSSGFTIVVNCAS